MTKDQDLKKKKNYPQFQQLWSISEINQLKVLEKETNLFPDIGIRRYNMDPQDCNC